MRRPQRHRTLRVALPSGHAKIWGAVAIGIPVRFASDDTAARRVDQLRRPGESGRRANPGGAGRLIRAGSGFQAGATGPPAAGLSIVPIVTAGPIRTVLRAWSALQYHRQVDLFRSAANWRKSSQRGQ